MSNSIASEISPAMGRAGRFTTNSAWRPPISSFGSARSGLGSAHAFLGYNRALLGNAGETLPAIERAMRLDPTDRHHSIWLFFGGFAELLVGQTEAAIALLRRSLARNPTYGSAELF